MLSRLDSQILFLPHQGRTGSKSQVIVYWIRQVLRDSLGLKHPLAPGSGWKFGSKTSPCSCRSAGWCGKKALSAEFLATSRPKCCPDSAFRDFLATSRTHVLQEPGDSLEDTDSSFWWLFGSKLWPLVLGESLGAKHPIPFFLFLLLSFFPFFHVFLLFVSPFVSFLAFFLSSFLPFLPFVLSCLPDKLMLTMCDQKKDFWGGGD